MRLPDYPPEWDYEDEECSELDLEDCDPEDIEKDDEERINNALDEYERKIYGD